MSLSTMKSTSVLSELPLIPLRNILNLLNHDDKSNLIKAAAGSGLEVKLIKIARIKKYICPICVLKVFENNKSQTEDQCSFETRGRDEEYAFFFLRFKKIYGGNDNWRVISDRYHSHLRKITEVNKEYYFRPIPFGGAQRYVVTKDRGRTADFRNSIEEISRNEQFKQIIKNDIEKQFFGGKFGSVTLNSQLKIYGAEELNDHLVSHFKRNETGIPAAERVNQFITKYGGRGCVVVNESFYENDGVNMEKVENLLEKVTAGRYLQAVRTTNYLNARALAFTSSKEFIINEIIEIFAMAGCVYGGFRFKQVNFSGHISLMKYLDMINCTMACVYGTD